MPILTTLAAASLQRFGFITSAGLGGITDQYFPYTTLLLHGDGTNGAQNNTFLDSSTNNFTITRNGNTTQGTFSPFSLTEGQWSNYFGSTTANLKFASNAAFGVGTGNFTVEFFLNISSWSGNQRFFMVGQSGTDGISFGRPNSDNIAIDIANSRIITYGWTPTVGRWYHLALVRSSTGSNQTTLYIDGVSVATGTSSGSVGQNAAFIGGLDWATSYNTQGYISNLRFSNSARTITVPTTPYTSDANTIILSCQSNRFKDNSANAFAITVNGNTSIQPFSPFAPSAAYSAATNGGSGYFDGSGDWLRVANDSAFDMGSGDFTIEGWFYKTTASGDQSICSKYEASFQNSWFIGISGSNWDVYIYYGSTSNLTVYTGAAPALNQWNHFALERNGANIEFYVNGSRLAQVGAQTIRTSTAGVAIGAAGTGYVTNYEFDGYISNLRIIKGTAAYSGSTYTVPTAPPTAITNTSLLLNFTNAGILDNTGRNDLETVGNAQISTSVKKFGTGSLAFDGTGDYLLAPASQNLVFGTGDFTIECWVYINSGSGSNNGILQISGTTGGLQGSYTNTITLYVVDTSGLKFGVYYANTLAYAGVTATTQTWTHLALVRSSGSLKLYINGTADSTFGARTDTTNYSGQNICVGGYYSTAYLWNGYIDDLRITKGVARYTSNFTPPTAAFEDQ